ncbi:MAG TPA: pyruvate kinase [Acidimicrobiia bacterium]
MRRTKIVATLGPSTDDAGSIGAVLEAGADVVRLNGAHGTPAFHTRVAELARDAARGLGRTVGVLVDLPGPKLRVGEVPGDAVELAAGTTFTLASAGADPGGAGVSTNVPDLPALAGIGDPIWLADGEIVLTVRGVTAGGVVTEVVRGGTLRSRKGLALPGAEGTLDPFTPADEQILDLAVRIGAELVGVSFVRAAADLHRVRAAAPGGPAAPVLVAKIETRAALEHLDDIVAAADVVMVARGDLGVQIDIARTPLVQKEVIGRCNRAGRPVVTATQMLESMTRTPIPTRAEASDVANAVLDGSDALMLSEETGVGAYPADTVATMARLVEAAEAWQPPGRDVDRAGGDDSGPWDLAREAVAASTSTGAVAIVCRTGTGTTARCLAALRPAVPVVAVTPTERIAAQLAVVRGVVAVPAPGAGHDLGPIVAAARASGAVGPGTAVAVLDGSVHVVPTI